MILLKPKLLLTHLPDFLPSRHVWNSPWSAPYPWIQEQVISHLFGEYAWFQRGYWHSYSSFYFILCMLFKKAILVIDVEHDSSALGAVQNKEVGGMFFVIINSYSATIKADMHCSHQILKTLGKLFERWGRGLFNVWIIYFWIWITEFSTANIRWSWDPSLVGWCRGGHTIK